MKRLIATYALLMVLSMTVVSCEHKELCYSHPHSAKVSVEFEWSQMPAAYSPGGMRVIFYPRNGGEEIASPAAKGAYTVKLNAANVKTNNAVVNLSDMNSPMMLIPQKLTKWSTYSAGAAVSKLEADNAIECYLEISMKLKQNDSYLIGSAAEYKTVYVPFDNATGWEPGKRYIYTLIFGGGYDDQGEPILSPITFDAATADWADASAGADVNVNF